MKLSHEDIKVLPLALIGAAQGFIRYYVMSTIVDRVESFVETRIPSQEALDALIEDSFRALEP